MMLDHFWMLVAGIQKGSTVCWKIYFCTNMFEWEVLLRLLDRNFPDIFSIQNGLKQRGASVISFFSNLFLWKSKHPRGWVGTEWNTSVMLIIFLLNQKREVCYYFTCQNTAQNHDIRTGNKILCKCGRFWAWEWQSQIMVKLWGN